MSKKKKNRLSPQEAWDQAYFAVDHSPLLEALGVELPDDLLRLALTHRSFGNEHENLPNNERLEFLGDTVLGISIAGQLYNQFPNVPESHLAKIKGSVVSRYRLAEVALDINLGPHILLGKGEISTRGFEKESILADTTEALFGAVYLEHGFEVARDTVLRLFIRKIKESTEEGKFQDWKTILQERVAQLHFDPPEYTASSTGPDHDRLFTIEVLVAGTVLGTGQGRSKKAAEQQAARQAVDVLGESSETVLALRKQQSEA